MAKTAAIFYGTYILLNGYEEEHNYAEKIREILETVKSGASASLAFEAEGTAYIRNFRPQERLILLGGGHIAQPLCRYGADLGFAATVVNNRPSFANYTRFPEAAVD